MAWVAEGLGVTPMALYRHVANKAGLLDGVVELLLTEHPLPAEVLPWSERLTLLAGSIRASAGRHPSVFPLLFNVPPPPLRPGGHVLPSTGARRRWGSRRPGRPSRAPDQHGRAWLRGERVGRAFPPLLPSRA